MASARRLVPDDPIVWRSPFAHRGASSASARSGAFLDDGPAPFVTIRCCGDSEPMQVRAEQVLHRADYGALHAIAPDDYPSPAGDDDDRFAHITATVELAEPAAPDLRLSTVAPASSDGGSLLVDTLAALATYGIPVRPLPGPTEPSTLDLAGCVAVGHGDSVFVTWNFPVHFSGDLHPAVEHLLEGIAQLLINPRDERGPLYVVELQRDEDNTLLGLLLRRARPR